MTHALLAALLILTPPPDDDDDALFGDDNETQKPDFSEQRMEAENDKLQLGGLLYLRSQFIFTDGSDIEDHAVTFPSLLEVYLDARPSDRVRAFAKGRLSYNPATASPFPGFEAPGETEVELDQLWLKLDIARAVYLTLGKQHLRWSVNRLWNPVDVINPARRELLSLYDLRPGLPLAKVHIPVESLGWNFYLVGLMDDVTTFDKAGVAARGEFVFGTVELGVVGAYRKGVDPKVGLDISGGLWDVELKTEASVRFQEGEDWDPTLQVSAGFDWGIKYSDEDVVYVAGEYFWNQEGGSVATGLASGQCQLFYCGEHHASLAVLLPSPGRWNDTSFSLFTLGNLSDKSFMTRFDVSWRVLTYLDVQLWVAAHFGENGELRLSPGMFGFEGPGQLMEAGLHFRLAL